MKKPRYIIILVRPDGSGAPARFPPFRKVNGEMTGQQRTFATEAEAEAEAKELVILKVNPAWTHRIQPVDTP